MKKIYVLVICYITAFQYLHAQIPAFNPNGVTVAGGNGAGPAANQLNEPNNVVADTAGNLIIADLNNDRIQKWAHGAVSGVTIAGGNGPGSAPNQFNRTTDVRFDPAGNMYVADFHNHRVQKFTPGSTTGITVAGGNGQGSAANQLDMPAGIFVDASANVYVADYYNHRIQKWAPGALAGVTVAGGNGYGAAANQLAYPNDVFVDGAGNIYIPDQNNHRVQKWAPGAVNGQTIAPGNGQGPAANQLSFPTGIWVDAMNNVFVADFGNDRVQLFTPGATTGITVAGGNGKGFASNQLNNPLNLFFDNKGNMYVCDVYNHRVQRFNAIGTCPPDTVYTLPSCSAKATITWSEPSGSYPAMIQIPLYLDQDPGLLVLMGTFNGHGYYRSSRSNYLWPEARDIADFIGDTSVNGHLVTITSAAESEFLVSRLKNTGLSPWIGLVSTGRPGNFRWVTSEPLSYTGWATGEPNNYLGNAANVAEPFVHMYEVGIWNDQRSITMPFIAEFEQPLLRTRQISGPANGSQQGPGVYTICYERTNTLTGQRDTCCFSITVKMPFHSGGGSDRFYKHNSK